MVVETDGAGVIDSIVGGVAEEEMARVLLFLTSASGLLLKFASKLKPLIHYPVFIPIKRKKTAKISLLKLWLPMLIL